MKKIIAFCAVGWSMRVYAWMGAEMGCILRAEGITKKFGKEEVLKGVSLEIEENTFTVLLGPSGSGKTTLLNVLSGLLKPTYGRVWCRGTEVTELTQDGLASFRRTCTGNVFQDYLLLSNLTVRENIEIGLCPGREGLDFKALVSLLELDGLLDKFPSRLSGGQQQRTAIARAVIKKPELLFCDEATGALDEENSKKVVALLHQMKEQYGITVLFVTHNLQIAETADRVITMKNGLLYQDRYNKNPIAADEMVWG